MVRETSLTFFEHLNELRRRLLASLAAFFAASLACYALSERLLDALLAPLLAAVPEVYFFSPQEAFLVRLKIALAGGFALASPVIFTQLWFFVSPALKQKEKRTVVPLALASSVLFLIGIFFAFAVVVPPALHILLGMGTGVVRPMISVSEYFSFLFGMLFAFGLAFIVPAVILSLATAGLVRAESLNRYQRHAVVLIFIAAAVLTPGPDLVSQFLLAGPLLFLFELSVAGAWFIGRSKGRPA